MADAKTRPQVPGPPLERGHPMPRRATEDQSVTLRHHRVAREQSAKPADSAAATAAPTISPRENSSGWSHETGQSDAEKWFDRSNRHPPAAGYDTSRMDVDPPFFQKETDSSNEEPAQARLFPFAQGVRQALLRPTVTHSSSADDFRSVIDDLTVENKRLKEELKRYRHFGPDIMRKEKLFEIKVHGLPKRKKRELEATLRDFAASLEGSSEAPSQCRKPSRHAKNLYYSGEATSKHASSSSSHSRPLDSGYGSMSHSSSNAAKSLVRPTSMSRTKSSGDQMAEDQIADTPHGLFPRHLVVTDKERKKIVVRRLEQLFTGQMRGRNLHRNQSMPDMEAPPDAPDAAFVVPSLNPEAAREARIQPDEHPQKKPRSRDNVSTSNSNGDQTESGGNGAAEGSGSGSGGRSGHNNNTSPPMAPPPEQRPTRPHDVDPDRVQIPAENMDYIRHLGMVPREFLAKKKSKSQEVSPDADGWVYLNLLCNLAQLHMLNVTPSFIRSAVSEMSTKFQLSPDGRKIRWRGGSDGTKFNSDSSGDNSQKSPSSEGTDGTDGGSKASGQRKKRKVHISAPSSKESKFGPQASGSSGSFHYKPLFVNQSSSIETSLEETGSQASLVEDSNMGGNTGNSKWDYSGSGSSQRKKRQRDGAIIYYSGAPFCTDLSGDPGDLSPTTYMTSTGQGLDPAKQAAPGRFEFTRTPSGSSLPIRPLSDDRAAVRRVLEAQASKSLPDLTADEGVSGDDEGLQLPWCGDSGTAVLRPIEPPLEPCGLGGVLPDDHFAVVVTTRRTILGDTVETAPRPARRPRPADIAEAIVDRLASMGSASPATQRNTTDVCIEIEYLSGRIRRFKPVPLPPPASFFPPFSTDSSSPMDTDDIDLVGEDDSQANLSSEVMVSQRANPHSDNTYPDNEDLSSNDEEDEVDGDSGEEEDDVEKQKLGPSHVKAGMAPRIIVGGTEAAVGPTGSSVATAGGEESGYSSSMEEDAE